MTKTLSINEVQGPLAGMLALAKDGDEIIIEDNGKPLATVSPIYNPSKRTNRTAGLGRNTIWISDDFDEALPDEFWGLDKES